MSRDSGPNTTAIGSAGGLIEGIPSSSTTTATPAVTTTASATASTVVGSGIVMMQEGSSYDESAPVVVHSSSLMASPASQMSMGALPSGMDNPSVDNGGHGGIDVIAGSGINGDVDGAGNLASELNDVFGDDLEGMDGSGVVTTSASVDTATVAATNTTTAAAPITVSDTTVKLENTNNGGLIGSSNQTTPTFVSQQQQQQQQSIQHQQQLSSLASQQQPVTQHQLQQRQQDVTQKLQMLIRGEAQLSLKQQQIRMQLTKLQQEGGFTSQNPEFQRLQRELQEVTMQLTRLLNTKGLLQQHAQNTQQQISQHQQQQQGGQPIGGAMTQQQQTTAETSRSVQKQLMLLIHAHKCQDGPNCRVSYCQTMKEVLTHMSTCTLGKQCTRPHCHSSRQIISHYSQCLNTSCQICAPLRKQLLEAQKRMVAAKQAQQISVQQQQHILQQQQQQSGVRPQWSSQQPELQQQQQGTTAAAAAAAAAASLRSPAQVAGTWRETLEQSHRFKLRERLMIALRECVSNKDARNPQLLPKLQSMAEQIEMQVYNNSEDRDKYYQSLAEKMYRLKKATEKAEAARAQQAQSIPQQQMLQRQQHQMLLLQKQRQQHYQQQQQQMQGGSVNPMAIMGSGGNASNASNGTAGGGNFQQQQMYQQLYHQQQMQLMQQQQQQQQQQAASTQIGSNFSGNNVPEDRKRKASRDGKSKSPFKPKQLKTELGRVLNMLMSMPDAGPFNEPVDYVMLSLDDYPTIIKHPMDLGTIKERLNNAYYDYPHEFTKDIRLVWDNAMLYNRKTSPVHKMAKRLLEEFEKTIDPAMQRLGYCCGGAPMQFAPNPIYCLGKCLQAIPRDAQYFTHEDRINVCEKCFAKETGDAIQIDSQTDPIPKHSFEMAFNSRVDWEEFVTCEDCGRTCHVICVLYNKFIENKFYCKGCRAKRGLKKGERKQFVPQKLPKTYISKFLEDKVKDCLKSLPGGMTIGEVTIRMVKCNDRSFEISPEMVRAYGPQGFPKEMQYRHKTIFAFQKIDGVDVCFFGMHVQEYGDDCPEPNRKRVYIAYLDSVRYFQPKEFRTVVYHEILIAYLEWCKTIGYRYAHIWACPPQPGDDYIFYCHPESQKTPKSKRLQDWYRVMLMRAKQQRIIYDFTDIASYLEESDTMSIPYFDGDYWPRTIEDQLREMEERKRAEAHGLPEGLGKGKKNSKKSASKKGKKLGSKLTKKGAPMRQRSEFGDLLFSLIEKEKSHFFTVTFNNPVDAIDVPIQDPDKNMISELMESRDLFLELARENHYQFDTLRRAKFSSWMFAYHLHNQDEDASAYTCNNCENAIQGTATRYHCNTCQDYDLCKACNEKITHEHSLVEAGLGFDDDNGQCDGSQGEMSQAEKRSNAIRRCIDSLVHACECKDPACESMACAKMKQVVNHTRVCQIKAPACPVCKQLVSLCCFHAKSCTASNCQVPFCPGIKKRLDAQKQQQRQVQQMAANRRVAAHRRLQGGEASSTSPSCSAPMSQAPFNNTVIGVPATPPSQQQVSIVQQPQTNQQHQQQQLLSANNPQTQQQNISELFMQKIAHENNIINECERHLQNNGLSDSDREMFTKQRDNHIDVRTKLQENLARLKTNPNFMQQAEQRRLQVQAQAIANGQSAGNIVAPGMTQQQLLLRQQVMQQQQQQQRLLQLQQQLGPPH